MEIACLITDDDLNVLAEHGAIVIHQPNSLLESMNEWCKTTHAKVTTTSQTIITNGLLTFHYILLR